MADKQIITKSQMIMRIAELSANLEVKEQECERTKERLESFQKDYSKLYQVVENKGYIKELDQLKAENDELEKELRQKKMTILMNNDHYFEVDQENKKLKQTLTEIKEIAEDESYIGFWNEQISEILQKINECEGENEV